MWRNTPLRSVAFAHYVHSAECQTRIYARHGCRSCKVNLNTNMRMWRNWQTRMIQVHVRNHAGSSPVIRTIMVARFWVAKERKYRIVLPFLVLLYVSPPYVLFDKLV